MQLYQLNQKLNQVNQKMKEKTQKNKLINGKKKLKIKKLLWKILENKFQNYVRLIKKMLDKLLYQKLKIKDLKWNINNLNKNIILLLWMKLLLPNVIDNSNNKWLNSKENFLHQKLNMKY